MKRSRLRLSLRARALNGPARNLLLPNQASLETSLSTWVASANCSILRSAAQAADGLYSLELTASAIGNMSVNPGAIAGVVPGKTYTCRASFRANTTARSCGVYVEWYDAGLALISGNYGGAFQNDSSSGWVDVFTTGAAPAGAAYVLITPIIASAAAGEKHYVDKVAAYLGSDPAWTGV